MNIDNKTMYIIYVSVLFTGDNVDHNILTIDGNGTFHGMGIIAVLAPRKQLGILVPRKQVAELHVKKTCCNWDRVLSILKPCLAKCNISGSSQIATNRK